MADRPELREAQSAFERARDHVWIERIGAGLAHRRAMREIEERVEAARRARDEAIREAVAAGGSYRAVAREAGISHSRVQQIVGEARRR